MPLRRTYAFIGLNSLSDLSEPTKNVHHTAEQPSPVPPPVPSATLTGTADMTMQALQPIINHPCRRFGLPPHRSSLLGPRQPSLLRQSLHPNPKVVPPFKPGKKLYRNVLNREFLRATKKATPSDMEAPTGLTTNDLTTDDQWPVSA